MKEPTILEIFGVRNQQNREVGIEIEIEGQNLVAISRFWESHNDGSLRGQSVEYVLKQPVERNKVGHRLKFLQEELKDHGANFELSDRCGVHVHINCQPLITKQVINFAIVYLILEDILVKWCGEDREGNLFCLRASDSDYIINGLVDAKEQGSLQHTQNDNYRYASLNLSSLRKFGSLEFRALRTPKKFNIIQTWVEMLLSIKDFSLNYDESFNIIEDLSANGVNRFVKNVLGDKFELVECPDIHELVMNGVRRVQDIAYTEYKSQKNKQSGLVDIDQILENPAVIYDGAGVELRQRYHIIRNDAGRAVVARIGNPEEPGDN